MSSSSSVQKKVIVDTDPGIDDAQAITMLLNRTDIEVVALTIVRGNIPVDQALENTARFLKMTNNLQIPVFAGCNNSLVNRHLSDARYFHGQDGFGEVEHEEDNSPGELNLQEQHAVQGILELVNQHPGEYDFMCLGPLTNAAMCIRLDPYFHKKIKSCWIMGGNYHGKGNINRSAEFNFHSDPESAYVLLKELHCDINIVSWELCLDATISKECNRRICEGNSAICKFVSNSQGNSLERAKKFNYITTNRTIADQLTAAIYIDSSVAVKQQYIHCTVELDGSLTRGQMIVDWMETIPDDENRINLFLEIDQNKFEDIMVEGIH